MSPLTQAQVDLFYEQGYLLVEDPLDIQQYTQSVIDEYGGLLGTVLETLYAEHRIDTLYRKLPGARWLNKRVVSGEYSP